MRTALVLTGLLAIGSHDARADGGKDRHVAQALAGVGTGLSASLMVAGLLVNVDPTETVNTPIFVTGLASSVITPSLGQIYAHEYLTPGMGVRALAAGAMTYAVFHLRSTKRCNVDQECTELTQQAVVVIGLAAIAYIGGAVYDIYDTPDEIDRYNRNHGIFVSTSVTATRTPDGHTVPVFGLEGRF